MKGVQFITNFFFRRRSVLLAALVLTIILHIVSHQYLQAEKKQIRLQTEDPVVINLNTRRDKFTNPIYSKWEKSQRNTDSPIEKHCEAYFKQLYSLMPSESVIDLLGYGSFDFDKTLYRQSSWFKQAEKQLRRKLKHDNTYFVPRHKLDLIRDFNDNLDNLTNYENQIVQEFNHKRIFGKCFLSENINNKYCSEFQSKLYPWMTSDIPHFIHWNGDYEFPIYDQEKEDKFVEQGCYIQDYLSKSNGKGIVIPFFSKSVDNVRQLGRLIKVLRGLKNQLPIEIMYIKDSLNQEDIDSLIRDARSEFSELPDSFKSSKNDDEPIISSLGDFPQQDIWFVDMTEIVDYKFSTIATTPTFIMTMSLIFNSFQEVILMTTTAIPVLEDFGPKLFNSEAYKKNGQLFFKNPSHLKIQRKNIVNGYNEINELIKSNMMPNDFDRSYFNLNKRRDDEFSMLVYNHRVQDIMDHNFMVIDKTRHLSGLLLASNLQFYKLMDTRFDLPHDIFDDSFWIALEMSGVNDQVHFNRHFGSIPGFLTPSDNKNYDKMSTSNELCSSSWCQIDENDDYSIIYVTTHQLEDYLNHPTFEPELQKKYKAPGSSKELDYPFLIENVLKPPTLLKNVHVPEFREPKSGWFHDEDFNGGKGHAFWCGYDVIGSPDSGVRGLVFEYGKSLQNKFNYIFDIWLDL